MDNPVTLLEAVSSGGVAVTAVAIVWLFLRYRNGKRNGS